MCNILITIKYNLIVKCKSNISFLNTFINNEEHIK